MLLNVVAHLLFFSFFLTLKDCCLSKSAENSEQQPAANRPQSQTGSRAPSSGLPGRCIADSRRYVQEEKAYVKRKFCIPALISPSFRFPLLLSDSNNTRCLSGKVVRVGVILYSSWFWYPPFGFYPSSTWCVVGNLKRTAYVNWCNCSRIPYRLIMPLN